MSVARWQPYYSDREVELDRRIHALGLMLALIATPLLLCLAAESRRPGLVLPCAIYALSLLGMLASSSLFRHPPLRWWRYRWFFRRLDHAAIFLFIAGTYTPFTVAQMRDGWAIGLTVAVWAGALTGAAYKLAIPVALQRPSPVAFAALASLVLFGLRPTLMSMAPSAVGLIGAGVAFYIVGAAIHHRAMAFHTPIWHGFVVAGVACHFAAVLYGVVLAPG
ncbi:MAG TPA: hemolysin III family protein [Stellaceae bacterium]|nr:hemolysin III family protein [Stellaceae bacterium]